MNMNGPVEISRQERLEICYELANRLQEVYDKQIIAIGVYGSVSRGTDGPYSDIEMLCVLKNADEEVDFSYEWSSGPWKAEVNVRSASVVLNDAATVEGDWPLTHGPFFSPLSLYDPDGFFSKLKEAAHSPSSVDFSNAIHEVLVGEMYEFIGKLRNANRTGTQSYLPYLAMQFAKCGAMLIGLHNRKLYSTGARVLPESLELPERPDGYDAVANMVMSGQLSEPDRIIDACEQFWNGLVSWAAEYGYKIHSERIPF
ncbi:ANT(4')-I family aminoglycoside nucleotidyltransferase [Paenibacillus alvei]|uniref:ANT(4')-I family aminoglycoside nucleotidyltransferase n=1 Tax=Paenibacillus alvei TaxID=44250 RepID=UPI000385B190|nr:ANT(4')-I family aminoglycoside nucleotidyltransferase [Paenibacillus alvei]EPY11332.1 aminoglycoside nucleotidyltransferase [Paenibacillus alvei A6-6i-x]